MAKRNYSTNYVQPFFDSNLSNIEDFMEVDDQVGDNNWTPIAEHDEERFMKKIKVFSRGLRVEEAN